MSGGAKGAVFGALLVALTACGSADPVREDEALRYLDREIAAQNRLLAHGFSRYDAHDVTVDAATMARIGSTYVSCATARPKGGGPAKAALVADSAPIIERAEEPRSFAWLRERLGCDDPAATGSEP